MKVSIDWLKELIDLKVSVEELIRLLPMRTIGFKETTEDFLELDMKGYNRADLLAMRGVAREVAAITNSNITFQDPPEVETNLPPTKIKIEAEELCPVYCIAKIEGLKSEPSKPEWVKKLNDCGMRTVNNIADITNLIMLEYGQPMHSFDGEKVRGSIRVRVAKEGEKIKTLDDKERILSENDLVIADDETSLGIAGVMGGKDSEATETTTTILLEAAIFDPVSIRRSVQRHNLYSEASKRFQHGLTKTNLLQALSAAIKMYEELGGKVTAISLVGDLEDKLKTVNLTIKKTNSLIGVELTKEQIEEFLEKLGFSLVRHSGLDPESPEMLNQVQHDGINWEVTVPYWRLDINIEEDLIEEVARMYGYEKIPAKELEGELPKKIDQSLFEKIYDTKKSLADTGLTEVQTYSFYSTKVLRALGPNNQYKDALVKVANPISSETEFMRDHIWPNLVEVIEKNIKQGYDDIAIFEIGKIYNAVERGLPEEHYHLSVALLNSTDNPIQELLMILKAIKPTLDLTEDGRKRDRFHPVRYRRITDQGKDIGKIAEVHPRFLNYFGINKRVAILEISL